MGALTLRSHLADKGLLDRFETRAIDWAEAAGVRWIELEGEFLTPAFHLAEVKGVQTEDFAKNAKLVRPRPYSEKKNRASEGLSRLLALPGVEACRVPTAYTVEGGYAISCRGAGRPDDVVSLVRQQWPDWNTNRSRFLLLNLPLALSYLLHGTSEAAKATRDLTIGTTIDLGKAAAARENAPLAVAQFSDDEAITAQLAKLMAMIHSRQTKTDQRVDHVEAELADVKGIATKAMQLHYTKPSHLIGARSKQPTTSTRHHLYATWHKHFPGVCPCCHSAVDEKNLEVDHWSSRNNAELGHLWLVCRGCNTRMGAPEADGKSRRTAQDRERFMAFRQMTSLPNVVQGKLAIDF